ncbi:MAG: hypothetical protein IKN67_03820 [Alphaproteobacteria bacterium]|nr:hypothetical protein [Alphaproteobacteria bacterium]
MESNVIVIIACAKLCKDLRQLKQLEYDNGKKVNYVGFYLCGASDKEDVAAFIKKLIGKDEFSEAQKNKFRMVLNLVENSVAELIDEDFKLFIARNMHQLEFNSWKCMTELMDSDRYLVLPIPQEVVKVEQVSELQIFPDNLLF